MERLTITTPATLEDCLDMAGSRFLARKGLLYMQMRGESLAIRFNDELLAVAFLVPDFDGHLEFCLSISPRARAHMRALCRFAHLTLSKITNTGSTVYCHVWDGNASGARMARLVGFSRVTGTRWTFKGVS